MHARNVSRSSKLLRLLSLPGREFVLPGHILPVLRRECSPGGAVRQADHLIRDSVVHQQCARGGGVRCAGQCA